MNDLAASDVAQRYGAQNRARRPLVIVAVGVLAAAALAWLAWVIIAQGRPMARSELVSFTVSGEHAARATLTVVRRDQNVNASCLLRAQATDHSIVGELNFAVGPPAPATTTLTKSIRTEREATSVSLVGCVAEGQAQRR